MVPTGLCRACTPHRPDLAPHLRVLLPPAPPVQGSRDLSRSWAPHHHPYLAAPQPTLFSKGSLQGTWPLQKGQMGRTQGPRTWGHRATWVPLPGRRALGTAQPIPLLLGLGREAGHLSPPSTQVPECWPWLGRWFSPDRGVCPGALTGWALASWTAQVLAGATRLRMLGSGGCRPAWYPWG